MIEHFIVTTVLIILEIIYLKLAFKLKIIDTPNIRSSHENYIVRGGGILIPMSLVLYSIHYQRMNLFIVGVIITSVISFIDDFRGLGNKWRIFAQLISVILLLLNVFDGTPQIGALVILLILSIGTINAVNFMDGINGITVSFGLVFIATFIYLNKEIKFVDQELLLYIGVGVFSFALFNFRTKALCFAGDVGSISLGYLLVYLTLLFYQKTENISVLAFWIVYGVDSVITIIYRLIKKENIFIAHRSHLYQYLANELNISHIKIAIVYGLLQAFINAIVIYNFSAHLTSNINLLLLFITSIGLLYLIIRIKVLKKISLGIK